MQIVWGVSTTSRCTYAACRSFDWWFPSRSAMARSEFTKGLGNTMKGWLSKSWTPTSPCLGADCHDYWSRILVCLFSAAFVTLTALGNRTFGLGATPPSFGISNFNCQKLKDNYEVWKVSIQKDQISNNVGNIQVFLKWGSSLVLLCVLVSQESLVPKACRTTQYDH